MRPGAALLLLLVQAGLGSGCAVVVTTAVVAGTVVATSVKTAGTVTSTTIKATGRVVTSSVGATGEVTALSVESAARLARAGAVVAVDAGTGAVTPVDWEEGLTLPALAGRTAGKGRYREARVFRQGRVRAVQIGRNARAEGLAAGDVVEFRN